MDLKDEIERVAGVPAVEQRLHADGRPMRDHEDLDAFFAGRQAARIALTWLDPAKADALKRIEHGDLYLKDLDGALHADRDIVLTALWKAGATMNVDRMLEAIALVDEALWSDRDVVLAAVACSGRALARASQALRRDR